MAFSLRNWFGGSRRRPDLRVVVYSRRVCPLCDEAWELLLAYQKRWGFTLDKVDVDESAELKEQFGNCVPVVVIDGKVRFRGHVNPVLLERLLQHD